MVRRVLITAGVIAFLGVLAVIFAVAGRTIGGAP